MKSSTTSKTLLSLLLAAVFCLSMMVPGLAAGTQTTGQVDAITSASQSSTSGKLYASGSGTRSDPWHIQNATQFANIAENLGGYYVLDNDIDFSKVDDWTPVGEFESDSMMSEEANTEPSFHGKLDGKGHTLKNLTLDAGTLSSTPVGIFGCVAGNGLIKNVVLKNIKVSGGQQVGALVGVICGKATLKNIQAASKVRTSGIMMVGGIVGGANTSKTLAGLKGKANVTMKGAYIMNAAGILIGGAEGTNLADCHATGGTLTVTGKKADSIGGLAGCAFDSASVKNCSAENVTIKVEKDCALIGGLLGQSGTVDGIDDASKATKISGCTVKNVKIQATDGSERIGMLIGGGYYRTIFSFMYSEPSAYKISNCSVNGTITGGKYVGAVVGYNGKNCSVKNCKSNVKWNGKKLSKQVGTTIDDTPVSELM